MYLLSHIFLILNKNRGLVGVSLKKNETVKGLRNNLRQRFRKEYFGELCLHSLKKINYKH